MTCAQGLLRLLWGGGPKLECYGTGRASGMFGGVNFVSERFLRWERRISLILILLVISIHIIVCKAGVVDCQCFGIVFCKSFFLYCGDLIPARHGRNYVDVDRIRPAMVLMVSLS